MPIRCVEAATRGCPLLLWFSSSRWLRNASWSRLRQTRQCRKFLGPLDSWIFELQRDSWAVLRFRACFCSRRYYFWPGTMRSRMISLPIRRVGDFPWDSDRSWARHVLPLGVRMRRCRRMVGGWLLQYGLRSCDGSRLERIIMVRLGRVSSRNVGVLIWHLLSISLPIRYLASASFTKQNS